MATPCVRPECALYFQPHPSRLRSASLSVASIPTVIRIEVLGDPVLRRPEGPVTGRAAYRRRVALLAILAAARGRPVGRERLIGLLWPEQPADSARHALSEALYVLRKELGDDTFVAVGDEVALSARRVATDLDEFERGLEEGRAGEVVRLYRGPFLDGFYVSDAPDFERWVDAERDRLARVWARAVEGLAEAAEAAGEPVAAADWWRELAARDPFSSRVALRLMRALLAAGEHTAALRHGAAHTGLLHDELGVGPEPELCAFVEQLRARAVPLPPPRPVPPREALLPAAEHVPPIEADPEPGSEEGPGAETEPGARSPGSVEPQPFALAPAEPSTEGAAATKPSATAPKPADRRRRALVYGAALLVVAAGVAIPIAGARRRAPPPVAAAPRYDPRRIAVLYFDDDSRGGELGYLARGLTEMLIHDLSQVPALDVVSRNGVKPYREGNLPLDSVAARLRAGSVVEGSVQGAGDSVRVTVQLIDANAQSHLESRVIVRPLGNVLALESALADEVSGFLRRRLGREVRLRQAAAETESPEARELVLRAEQARADALGMAGQRHALDQRSAAGLLERADSLLRRAEAADPAWARPSVLRGEVALALAGRAGLARSPALLARAVGTADRVLARHPRYAPALALRGLALWRRVTESADTAGQRDRLDRAERDLRAAVDADSSLASAWATLSQVLRLRGAFAESDLAARHALAQDAYLDEAPDILQRLYFGAMAQGDYAEAGRLCDRGRAQLPDDWRFVECRLTLLREDPALPPDPALAWRLVAELERLDPAPRARGAGRSYSPLYRRASAAAVLARAGHKDSARAVLARARSDAAGDPDLRVSFWLDDAYVRVLLGERDEARRLLDAYLKVRPTFADYARRDVAFRGLFAAPAAPARGR
ncbi:MAG: Protein kinase [Gemmatimonadetes bacterium]|nr:Protein kinase [Gemmatimonadota bacterium]